MPHWIASAPSAPASPATGLSLREVGTLAASELESMLKRERGQRKLGTKERRAYHGHGDTRTAPYMALSKAQINAMMDEQRTRHRHRQSTPNSRSSSRSSNRSYGGRESPMLRNSVKKRAKGRSASPLEGVQGELGSSSSPGPITVTSAAVRIPRDLLLLLLLHHHHHHHLCNLLLSYLSILFLSFRCSMRFP